jgi:hypothetical protein
MKFEPRLLSSLPKSSRPYLLTSSACVLACVLIGCVGMPSERSAISTVTHEQPLEIETRARLPILTGEAAELIEGLVRAGIGERRLSYSARYAFEPGSLLATLVEEESSDLSAPTDIGQQTMHQQVHLNLSEDVRLPLLLGLENRRDHHFLLDGEQVSHTTRAHLDFKPEPLSVRLDWRLPDELSTAPLGCHFNGRLSMPLAAEMVGMNSVLNFSHSECYVRAVDRGLDALPVQSRAVAWRWGTDFQTALRYRQVLPIAQSTYTSGPSHEVGLSHREEFNLFGVQLDLARREVGTQNPVLGHQDVDHWVADLLINGKLGLFDITARYMRAGDPLWFMPLSTPSDSSRFSLLLDFGTWLKEGFPGLEADMSASFDRTEQSNGVDDNQVNWNVSLTW